MPVAIYAFTLCAFAIGFAEFISIGLAASLADSLQASAAQVGLAATLYAAGVVIGATILTALAAGWSRKRPLLVAMLAFTAGNVLAALSTALPLLLAARLLSGLAHGVFFAVASSVATRLVAPERAGVAMALGVPAGTWLGSVLPWQWIFALIALCGLAGALGVARWMPAGAGNITSSDTGWRQLPVLFDRRLLAGASLPLLSHTGAFALYTFITPLLLQVTHTDIRGASAILLAYGIGAAIGNVVGGRMTDHIGMDRASLWLLAGISAVLALIGLAQGNFAFMVILVMALGLTTYGAIPPLQSRILRQARRHRPQALDVASGLNIAAFNTGVPRPRQPNEEHWHGLASRGSRLSRHPPPDRSRRQLRPDWRGRTVRELHHPRQPSPAGD
ncbi:MFS transporter [Paraburkholderia caledonica]|uniref:MFS family arabinose efflux permease n=1 Tax=Paraburkholderia caledonica TaxID=134536 RepID=A0AB73INB2_9BURK|nr:putative MFS family arabinose efflux permease [Paraburkholderia caledonica]